MSHYNTGTKWAELWIAIIWVNERTPHGMNESTLVASAFFQIELFIFHVSLQITLESFPLSEKHSFNAVITSFSFFGPLFAWRSFKSIPLRLVLVLTHWPSSSRSAPSVMDVHLLVYVQNISCSYWCEKSEGLLPDVHTSMDSCVFLARANTCDTWGRPLSSVGVLTCPMASEVAVRCAILLSVLSSWESRSARAPQPPVIS